MHSIYSGQGIGIYPLLHPGVEYSILYLFLCIVIASKTHCVHLCIDCRSQDAQMSILSMKTHLFL